MENSCYICKEEHGRADDICFTCARVIMARSLLAVQKIEQAEIALDTILAHRAGNDETVAVVRAENELEGGLLLYSDMQSNQHEEELAEIIQFPQRTKGDDAA